MTFTSHIKLLPTHYMCFLLPISFYYDPCPWLALIMILLSMYASYCLNSFLIIHIHGLACLWPCCLCTTCFLLPMFFCYDPCSWLALLMSLVSINASYCLNSFVMIHVHGLACYDLVACVLSMLPTTCIPLLCFMFMACFAYDLVVYVWHILILLPIYIKDYVLMNQCPYALALLSYASVYAPLWLHTWICSANW